MDESARTEGLENRGAKRRGLLCDDGSASRESVIPLVGRVFDRSELSARDSRDILSAAQ